MKSRVPLSFWCLVLLCATVLPMLVGCVSPGEAKPVAVSNRETVRELADLSIADLAMLRESVRAQVDALRIIARGDMHRELILNGYLDAEGKADTLKLENDLQDPEAHTALVQEIRLGRMDKPQAIAWLRDFAALLPVPGAKPLRDSMIDKLAAREAEEATFAAIETALDTHAAYLGRIITEADANAASLEAFASADYQAQDALKDFADSAWSRYVVKNIKSPQQKTAAQEFWAALFGAPKDTVPHAP